MIPAARTAGALARGRAGRYAARCLRLAAAPTFVLMALATAVLGETGKGMLCSAGALSPLGGMVPMYLLMALFHAVPWLELTLSRNGGERR
jgi:hypothetical protein